MQKEVEVQKLMEENVRLSALLDKKEAQLVAMNEQCKVMALSASHIQSRNSSSLLISQPSNASSRFTIPGQPRCRQHQVFLHINVFTKTLVDYSVQFHSVLALPSASTERTLKVFLHWSLNLVCEWFLASEMCMCMLPKLVSFCPLAPFISFPFGIYNSLSFVSLIQTTMLTSF